MDSYRLFRSERQDRQGGGTALYVKEELDCTALAVGNDMVESLCVRIRGKSNKVDVVVGIYYRSPGQDGDTDVLFYMELREISRSVALVLMGDFNFTDVNWDCHTADTNRSRKFHVEDNLLAQVLKEPTRKSAFLDLLFVNRERLVGELKTGGCLGHSNHEVVKLQILGDRKKTASNTSTLMQGEQT